MITLCVNRINTNNQIWLVKKYRLWRFCLKWFHSRVKPWNIRDTGMAFPWSVFVVQCIAKHQWLLIKGLQWHLDFSRATLTDAESLCVSQLTTPLSKATIYTNTRDDLLPCIHIAIAYEIQYALMFYALQNVYVYKTLLLLPTSMLPIL